MSLQLPERFEVVERLGAGAMGVVYRVYDRERGTHVALKTLTHVDPEGIYRFKQEFRALANVTHPNLVALYELQCDAGQWFFTMELIDGETFLAQVRPEAGEGRLDLERLRETLRQLAQGVGALHEAGHLHRDIRPSNVLVARDGRVVLVDFGLATAMAAPDLRGSTMRQLVGTPAYMSPEQAAGLPLTEATDWYSVGVMLYEALTGRLPFGDAPAALTAPTLRVERSMAASGGLEAVAAGTGSSWLDVLLAKQQADPLPPRDIVDDVPDDLDTLCVRLLHRRADDRPSGRDVLRELTARAPAGRPRPTQRPTAGERPPFIGRERHLLALQDAFRAVQRGKGLTVHVHGRSGMGKTALVRHFLDELIERDDAVVLEGRCYERELVAYKALDSVVDALSRHLVRLPPVQVAELMPRNVHALARVFPVIARVEAVAAAPQRAAEVPDPQELRQRAFSALRELLARVSDRRPLVVWIDDVQWGDLDSAGFLADLLRPPDAPVLLLVLSYRSEDAASSPLVTALLKARAEAEPTVEWREVVVDGLSVAECQRVALALFGRDSPAGAQTAAIAEESGGNPFLVHELVRYVQGAAVTPDRLSPQRVRLEDVLVMRVVALPEKARRLLEVVALAGRPLHREIACRAAELGADERAALATLLSGHLVRTRGPFGDEEIETYHDRIRETTVHHLSRADVPRYHLNLARALEASGRADPQELALHFQSAGETTAAAEHALVAARQAAAALAFDRAARLFRLALELRPVNGADGRALRIQLGEALSNAGRGGDAARNYLEAAVGASPTEALRLQMRAAEQLLISGHIDEGLEAMRTVLAAAGMRMARTPVRAMLSIVRGQLRFRLRGLRYRERDAAEISERELMRFDVCYAVAAGLSMVDTLNSADFQLRALLLALRAGEPHRISKALTLSSGIFATAGGPARKRAAKLIQATETLAHRLGTPDAIGLATVAAGAAAYLVGEWERSLELCDRAETMLRDRCTGVARELATARRFALGALMYMGEFAELARRATAQLAEAVDRGNLHAVTDLRTRLTHLIWLAADDPAGARREVLDAIAQWSERSFHVQHYSTLLALIQTDLYEGKGGDAWKRFTQQWRALARSQLMRVQVIRVEVSYLRARAALAAAAERRDASGFLRAAARDAHRIERESMPWSTPLADLLRAGIAATAGDIGVATARLRTAAAGFDVAAEALYAAVARRRLGQLLGGADGEALIAAADAQMRSQRIQNPARMTAAFAPGFRDGS